ncbi:MAG: cbb3-type cytochrome c oxidase subunit II [Limisphaerales bacterium]
MLGSSWCGFVFAPTLQLGGAKQTTILNSSEVYPVQRTGDATLGLQVYRANGCAACHTTQVQQDNTLCDVVLTGAGKNPAAVIKAIAELIPSDKGFTTNNLPKIILHGINEHLADAASDKISAAGGKAEINIVPSGTDIARGWGVRHSVAEDFLWDYPVQLGSLRAGPDLANVGLRYDANWQLLHLYAPSSVVKDSRMPSFRYLFETRKIGRAPSADALNLPKEFAPADGYEIVPKTETKQLAAYLLSLRADVPLYSAPFTQSQPSTNAPVAK